MDFTNFQLREAVHAEPSQGRSVAISTGAAAAEVNGRTPKKGVSTESDGVTDPLLAYLHDIPKRDPLSPEQEANLAKRIEEGREAILRQLCAIPVTVDAMRKLYEALAANCAERIENSWDMLDDEEAELSEDEEKLEPAAASGKPVSSKIGRPGQACLQIARDCAKLLEAQSAHYGKGGTMRDRPFQRLEAALCEQIATTIRLRDARLHKLVETLESPMLLEGQIIRAAIGAGSERNAFLGIYRGCESSDGWIEAVLEARRAEQPDLRIELESLRRHLGEMGARAGLPLEDFLRTGSEARKLSTKLMRDKKEMLEDNLHNVIFVAKKYTNRGLQLLDLIQEGNIGLMKAVEKFEHRRGNRFWTHAKWWVRATIERSIADQARTIRIPAHMIEIINKISCTGRQMLHQTGREPEPEELARRLGMPLEKVQDALDVVKQPISFETPIGGEGESHLSDFIENIRDKEAQVALEAAMGGRTQPKLAMALIRLLTPREERVLRLHYGIGLTTTFTFDEIGQQFDIARQNIHKTEKKAFKKLAAFEDGDILRQFLEFAIQHGPEATSNHARDVKSAARPKQGIVAAL